MSGHAHAHDHAHGHTHGHGHAHGHGHGGGSERALRLALIKGRYREPISWSDDLVNQSKAQLDRLYGALQRLDDVPHVRCAAPAEFLSAMDDYLNTPLALAE